MTRNETIGRHGSVESSWSSRSGDTIRPYGRAGSLRGTPVTVKTDKNLNSRYVVASGAVRDGRWLGWRRALCALDLDSGLVSS